MRLSERFRLSPGVCFLFSSCRLLLRLREEPQNSTDTIAVTAKWKFFESIVCGIIVFDLRITTNNAEQRNFVMQTNGMVIHDQ